MTLQWSIQAGQKVQRVCPLKIQRSMKLIKVFLISNFGMVCPRPEHLVWIRHSRIPNNLQTSTSQTGMSEYGLIDIEVGEVT